MANQRKCKNNFMMFSRHWAGANVRRYLDNMNRNDFFFFFQFKTNVNFWIHWKQFNCFTNVPSNQFTMHCLDLNKATAYNTPFYQALSWFKQSYSLQYSILHLNWLIIHGWVQGILVSDASLIVRHGWDLIIHNTST